MKRILFLLFALTACANPKYASTESSSAGETFQPQISASFHGGNSVGLRWESAPTEEDFGSFTFLISRNGTAVDPQALPSVVLWMPSMGHGSSPVTVERLGSGKFRATKVFFAMKGQWEIHIQMPGSTEGKDEAILPFTF